jgi:hypothetical protein
VAGSERRWFGPLILNDPPDRSGPATGTGPAGEAFITLTLRALGAHTGGDGRVDHAALRASAAWASARAQGRALAGLDLATLREPAERLAFWINVYNAAVIHGVAALGLRRSVRETWNFFGRVALRVGGLVLSLDDIEHGVLRGNRRRVLPPWPPFRAGDPRRALACAPVDPRLHCAINCGARACPPVRVFRAAGLDAQLELATRGFVNQEVGLDARGRITCSKIFRWYRQDFERAGGLRAFLARHLDDGPVKAALAAGATPCQRFRPYSWALAQPPVD